MGDLFDGRTSFAIPQSAAAPSVVTVEAFLEMVVARGIELDPVAIGICTACHRDVSVFDVAKRKAYEDAADYAVRCVEARRERSRKLREARTTFATSLRMDKDDEV